MRVYILSVYEEYGAEQVKATLDPTKLSAMLREFRHPWKDQPVEVPESVFEALTEVLAEDRLVDGRNLSEGWGGWQLHIVELT